MSAVKFSVRQLGVVGSCAAMLCGVRSAHAFCRAVTEPVPETWQQDMECWKGSDAALEVYWKGACASYSLQQDASRQVSFAQASAVAAKAFLAWKNADCTGGGHPSIDATYDMSPVECSAVQYNPTQPNQNVIVFRDDAWPHPGQFNTLGLTRLKYGLTTGEIFDADMEINSTADHKLIVDGIPANSNEILLESVITHEAGHFLGLGHSTQQDAIMYARYQPDASPKLSQDDIDGICTIYPPDGTRKAKQAEGGAVQQGPCDATPVNGFSGACGSPDGGSVTIVDAAPIHRSGCSVSDASSPASAAPFIGLLGWALTRSGRTRLGRNRETKAGKRT